MKYVLGSALCAAAFVLCPVREALAEDSLHEDGTWGPDAEEPGAGLAAPPGPQQDAVESDRPRRKHRPLRRHRERRKKLPPIEVEPQAAQPPPAEPAAEPASDGDRVRFRGGVGLDLGAYSVAGSVLALAGVEGRLGIQFSDCFGLYATPSFWLGAGEWDFMGRVALGLVPEITLGDVFFIGAGPELFAAGSASSELGDPLNIAIRTRTGFAFGRKRPGRRHAFTLAFDGRVDFYEEGVGVAPTVGLGYDAF